MKNAMRYFFKTPYRLLLSVVLLFASASTFGQAGATMPTADTSGLITPGAALQLVSQQFSFTEGPAVDQQGNIYFTDQPNDAIWKWSTDGTLALFLHGAGRANGLYIDQQNNIIACSDSAGEIRRITPAGKQTVLYKAPKRKRLNGPNDLWIHAQGGIYMTDPFYQRPYWTHKQPARKGQYVYYLPPGKKKLIAVETTLKQPNGIVGTPDGKHLFVADIGDGKTYKYDIGPNGTLQNKRLFISQGSDGITLDEKSNLYITGNGVTVYNPAGQKIAHIAVPGGWTANVCFGGSGKNILFITASKAVYTLQMNVKGVE